MPNLVKEIFSLRNLLTFKDCSYAENKLFEREIQNWVIPYVKEHFLLTFIEACSSLLFYFKTFLEHLL